ncbi:hypothetical protein DP44_4028 [Burkholderia pseudomallei]|nr:hypothetical protein DP44_4028 [Burkholderia pseudomallei]
MRSRPPSGLNEPASGGAMSGRRPRRVAWARGSRVRAPATRGRRTRGWRVPGNPDGRRVPTARPPPAAASIPSTRAHERPSSEQRARRCTARAGSAAPHRFAKRPDPDARLNGRHARPGEAGFGRTRHRPSEGARRRPRWRRRRAPSGIARARASPLDRAMTNRIGSATGPSRRPAAQPLDRRFRRRTGRRTHRRHDRRSTARRRPRAAESGPPLNPIRFDRL